jgi:hypothetical protein
VQYVYGHEYQVGNKQNISSGMVQPILCVFVFLVLASADAFVPCTYNNPNTRNVYFRDTSSTKRFIAPDIASSLIVATIDADIANIPTNEFAPIFAGGIAVMFGGLFSALAVGFIIDKRDLYVNIVADSYAQGADDAEFWKGLSEEEKKKTQELLQRLKESKEGGRPSEKAVNTASIATPTITNSAVESNGAKVISVDTSKLQEKKEIGMFSDYGDE